MCSVITPQHSSRTLGLLQRLRHFDVESWPVIVERRRGAGQVSEATVKLLAKGERIVPTGEENRPVNALDTALHR